MLYAAFGLIKTYFVFVASKDARKKKHHTKRITHTYIYIYFLFLNIYYIHVFFYFEIFML